MIRWTTLLLYMIDLAQATSISLTGQPRPWNVSMIDITFVDYATPQQTIQARFEFGLYYRPTQYIPSWCHMHQQSPNGMWNFCGTFGLHARITDVKISDSVEFSLHMQRYSWTKDTNNTAEPVRVHADYAKLTIKGNSTGKDNMLSCRLRRQGKDLKCISDESDDRGVNLGLGPFKIAHPTRSSFAAKPLTVKNVTLRGPYPDTTKNCTLEFNVFNPNREVAAAYKANTTHLLTKQKRDFGACSLSFACSRQPHRWDNVNEVRPDCPGFQHELVWQWDLDKQDNVDMQLDVISEFPLTVGTMATWWNMHLNSDPKKCGARCGRCSDRVCSWGGFDQLIDNMSFSGYAERSEDEV